MNTFKIISLIGIALLTWSCTEEIDIDLNDAEPQLVIEALVSTDKISTVTLSQTINFDEANDFPSVSNALVEISDNSGNNEALQEQTPGVYVSSALNVVSGNTYSLNIIANDKNYTASCQIPQQVSMDSIQLSKELDGGFFGNSNDSVYQIRVYFTDPADTENYYQFVEYLNGERVRSYTSGDSRYNGQTTERVLNSRDRELRKGDTIAIEMRCITAEVYDYLNDLHSRDAMSATPTNPRPNIENAKLGYFSAHTSETKLVIY